MTSRIQQICDAVMETMWLAVLVIAPLFFDVYSQRVFEPDKISLVRTLAVIAVVAWLIKHIDRWGASSPGTEGTAEPATPLWKQPFVWQVGLLAGVYLLSTLLSVTPRQSFWGSYQRLQGTYTMFSYMALFLVTIDTLRSAGQWRRLQYTLILTSLPIALYGILQHFHLDPLPWGGETSERVASNMGNAIFVAAYLIMAVGLTVERFIDAARHMLDPEAGNTADALTTGALLFILVVQIIAIIFTQSRGPWLGLAAGSYIFIFLTLTSLRQRAPQGGALRLGEVGTGIGMGVAGLAVVGAGGLALLRLGGIGGALLFGLSLLVTLAFYLVPLLRRTGWRWLWLSVFTQTLLIGAVLIVINLPSNPFPGIKQVPYVGRLARMMETQGGTGRVRTLIWEGVVDMMQPHAPLTFPDGHTDRLNPIRTLVGYGPESMWVAYNRFYRPELGDIESRRASPDRSHNETFDSLVITGVIGFLSYILLFSSAFYYALKWLGLIQRRRDALSFAWLAGGGILLGILIPVWLGQARFAGVGVALGFITGVIAYITFAAIRGGTSIQELDRRQMIIIAILSTIVAHFIEIHFGIAIVSTRTYFYILLAALAVIGTSAVDLHAEAAPAPVPVGATRLKRRRRGKSRRPQAPKPRTNSLWRQIVPYALITALILLVIDFDYVSNQTGLQDTMTIFIRSWTTHLQAGHAVAGPGALWLVLFTVVVGLVLAMGEIWRSASRNQHVTAAMGIYGGLTLAAWLFYGLVQAARLLPLSANIPLAQRADHVAGHIGAFWVWLFITLLALAMGLLWHQHPHAATWSLTAKPVRWAAVVVILPMLFLLLPINLNLVKADIYFKLGQSTDAQGNWQASLTFYDQASQLAPYEDYYQLFRGRALLERARREKDPTQQKVFFDRAEEVLRHARELNPLNTDHSANLARYYATRASSESDPAQSRLWLEKSAATYLEATRLSPNVAHLQNEWGSVYLQMGEIEKARQRFAHSLELDPSYNDTYLRLAQLESRQQNWQAALDAYTRAAQLAPKDVRGYSGRGYVLAQLGRTDEAIAANLDVLAIAPTNVSALQNLAILYQQQGQLQQALDYAQQAKARLPEANQAGVDALIQQIQQQMGAS
ncbi:MAG: tetratricopeptide repeat protein [Chloroflexi bacterium]|nr:tetratricopeptide repeat protein [Chloroflexota bacterium]